MSISHGHAALLVAVCGCAAPGPRAPAPERPAADPAVFWNSATIYFLLTDRFQNGDPSNDLALGRAQDGAVLRTFQGGDLAGVLAKLREGYFDSLGVTAIWMTPFVEQIHGSVDEGTGKTYGFHGYWTATGLPWTRRS
ncbi:MAG TPA: alpha-amylase family glycosyl hydrolase, partial [Gemmatimonadales bacterium]|nr:alpha-amylase family glycosyl hydrolase [Gemmatimonadales bacterium]